MAKDLRYYLKFDSNGRKLMDELGISSKQLDEALEKVGKTSKKTHQSLMSMASVTVIVEGVTRAIDGLHNTMRELANANAVQVEAETKLLTIMKQRMDATNDEFESIKQLASAQQELGIIGDEVQLTGAQQLATYITQTEALQMLIPAMNNLVAQQKGFNATTSDAVSIGNLFGKAMMGEASALKEVGITFTAAQKNIIETGSELEKAATLAQVITDNVGNMNEALAQTEAGKLKQVENAMGDQKEVLGGLVACFMPYISKVNEAIKAGGHIVTVTNAFESLTKSVFGAGAAQKAWNLTAGVGRTGSLHLAASLRSVGASAKFTAACTKAAALALRGLTMVAGGAALAGLVYLIGELCSKSKAASVAAEQLQECTEEYTRAAAEAKQGIDSEITKLKHLIDTKGDTATAVKELNDKYGDTFGVYKTAAEWYDTLVTKGKLYIKQIGLEAQARALASKVAEAAIKKDMAQEKVREIEKSGKTTQTNTIVGAGLTRTEVSETREYAQAKKDLADAIAVEEELDHTLSIIQKKSKEVADQIGDANGSNGSSGPGIINGIKDRIKELEKLRDAAKTVSEIDKYNQLIEDERARLKNLQGGDKTDEKTGLINDVQAAIGKLEDLHKSAKTLEEINAIDERIKIEKHKLNALQNGMDPYRPLGKVDAKPTSLEFDPGKVAGVKLRDLQKSLGKGYMLDVKLMPKLDTKPIEAIKELKPTFADLWGNIQGVAGGFDTITGAIENSGSAWEKLNGIISGTLQIFQSMSQVIPMVTTLTQALIPVKQQEAAVSTTNANANANEATAKLMAAHAGIPWVGIAIAGGMLAAMTAMMFAMPKFAKGGIAYGPTFGLFGEYAGASNNPEVVAPLDRLRSLIRPADSGPGRLTATLKGRDIQIVYERRKTFESTM